MKTYFTEQQIASPILQEAASEIEKCRHYGFCTATCPTYVLLGDELDSPRGRVDLIGKMLEAGGVPDPSTVKHLDRCLSCMACTTTCPTSIDYGKLIDIGREYIEENYRRPLAERALRTLIAKVLPNPALFRLSMLAASVARPFSGVLGSKLAGMIAMTKALKPQKSDFAHLERVDSSGAAGYRVALLEGCVQKVIGVQINDATIRILSRHGCEIYKPRSVGCCGSLPLHMGRGDEARALARRAVDAWHSAIVDEGVQAIIINASGCGTTIKDYGHLLKGDPDYASKAQIVADHALDISEWLVRIGIEPVAPLGLRVAYHDPCSLQHAQRVTSQPRQLLTRVGCDVVNVPERHMCCGSAGTYNMLQPEIAGRLGKRKAENISRTKPEVIATGNIGCMNQIQQYSDVPIVHFVELLDWATGGKKPVALCATALNRG
ncbi:glycolate oxidase subunit GlcF [Sphingobium boeckii]|uniref:Glycolate oxidase iron-sulfur subunit n=1 Tax=Sphingobium boeckii TaxID=1082345 RepID=A0A7W9AIL9_9SPHN|nr:glycolate oxidase subunit GlcF [Sphingobium boeckii]MBB5686348.1 glycolate oxidase iron-sulfur subunit [Sphingobium boeckii]